MFGEWEATTTGGEGGPLSPGDSVPPLAVHSLQVLNLMPTHLGVLSQHTKTYPKFACTGQGLSGFFMQYSVPTDFAMPACPPDFGLRHLSKAFEATGHANTEAILHGELTGCAKPAHVPDNEFEGGWAKRTVNYMGCRVPSCFY